MLATPRMSSGQIMTPAIRRCSASERGIREERHINESEHVNVVSTATRVPSAYSA